MMTQVVCFMHVDNFFGNVPLEAKGNELTESLSMLGGLKGASGVRIHGNY